MNVTVNKHDDMSDKNSKMKYLNKIVISFYKQGYMDTKKATDLVAFYKFSVLCDALFLLQNNPFPTKVTSNDNYIITVNYMNIIFF